MTEYNEFLKAKVSLVHQVGMDVPASALHPSTLPHQADAIRWALRVGRALIAMSFGLGKTHVQVEIAKQVVGNTGGRFLIVCPLGVKHQFTEEDGPRLGVRIQSVRTDAEVAAADTPYLITNYERVRDGDIDVSQFSGISLDEGSVLRSLGSKTQDTFTRLCKAVPYRFVATATPSPNEYREIIYYAQFLEHMDIGQALTRWFKRDPNKAGNLTIHPHHEQAFWMWVASWALFVNKPSDLGHSDEGYDLPELRVHWHRLPVDHTRAWEQADNRGQHRLLLDAASGVPEAVAEKRATLGQRVAKAAEIVAGQPGRHWLLWHHLEDERKAITEAIPASVAVYGSQKLEERERRILDFAHGQIPILSSKPEIAGSGCNFQYHCHSNIFLGVDYRFQDFIQAIHRTHRFQQSQPVDVHIIYAESEDEIVSTLRRKWQQHDKLVARMSEIVRQYGLSEAAMAGAMQRSLGVMREETAGQLFTAIHNDTVQEAPRIESDSVGLVLTSIPFGNHYEYAASLNDFGHNEDDDKFFVQMDYLIPELYRTLMPGRIAAIHVKDRIMYGWQGESGFMWVNPFSDKTVAAFQKHGFLYQGRITITTDVVRENNSTYRLGYTEMTRDGSKMGVGLPEYVLLFRKPPTDNTTARADVPVVKDKADYTIGRWQLDAHAFWRSDGNRPLSPWEAAAHYDYEAHVAEMERLDDAGNLPKYFLIHAPESPSFYCWSDVNLMQGLNAEQARRRQENHVCPLPFDIVDRLIRRYSNEGELVYDPFAGLFTVPYCAVRMGRRGLGVELNHDYYTWGVRYMQMIERQAMAPTLFDLHEFLAEPVAAEAAL
jgi:DNA modification methylase